MDPIILSFIISQNGILNIIKFWLSLLMERTEPWIIKTSANSMILFSSDYRIHYFPMYHAGLIMFFYGYLTLGNNEQFQSISK